MLRIWSFRFVLFFILVLITQPHFRFHFLIPFRLGNLTFGLGLALHVIDSMGAGRPLIRLGPTTKLSIVLLVLALLAHYLNPNQWAHGGGTALFDSLWKVCVVAIILEAQVDNLYKASAVVGTLAVGTLWWLKGGVRLAQAEATWSGDRLMGANVSIIKNPNDFAYQLIFVIPIYYFFFSIVKNKYIKWGMLGLILVAIYLALETGSRTGLLAFVTLAAVMLPRLIKESAGSLLIAGVGVALLWTMVVSPGNRDRLSGVFDAMAIGLGMKEESETEVVKADAESAGSRRIKAQAAWNTILQHPVMGVGTRPDPAVYDDPNAGGMVHNEILMAGRTMGFPGMIVYGLLIFVPMRLGHKVFRMARVYWPEVSELGYAIRNQMFVVIVGGAFSPSFFHFPHLMCAVAGTATYVLLLRRLQEDGIEPEEVGMVFEEGAINQPEWAPA